MVDKKARAYVSPDEGTLCIYGDKPFRCDKTWLAHDHASGLYGVTPYAWDDVAAEYARAGIDLDVDPNVGSVVRRAASIDAEMRSAVEGQGIDVPLENGETLYDHQKLAVAAYVASGGRYLLSSPVGSGKSYCAIAMARHMDHRKNVVVCPSSVKYQWEDYLRDLDASECVVIEGRSEAALSMDDPPKWVVLNWSILKDHVGLLTRWAPEFAVIDEGHRMKNRRPGNAAQRAVAANQLIQAAENTVILTGTPIRNRPKDLWSPFDALQPGWWGNYWSFTEAWCDGYKGKYGWVDDGISHEDVLHDRQKAVMVRWDKSILDLPPQRRHVVRVPLTDAAMQAYAELERDFKGWVSSHDPASEQASVLGKIVRLRHVSSTGRLDATIKKAVEYVREERQVVVFAYFRNSIQGIVDGLKASDASVGVITGDTKGQSRRSQQQAFMAGDLDVMVGQVDAMGEGINLQCADASLHHDVTYTPFDLVQCEGRIHRIGQDRPVVHTYYVGRDTFDEHIVSLVVKKAAMAESALATGEEVTRDLIDRVRGEFFDGE